MIYAALMTIWIVGWIGFAGWALVTTWSSGEADLFLLGGLPLAAFGFLWPVLLALVVAFAIPRMLVQALMDATGARKW